MLPVPRALVPLQAFRVDQPEERATREVEFFDGIIERDKIFIVAILVKLCHSWPSPGGFIPIMPTVALVRHTSAAQRSLPVAATPQIGYIAKDDTAHLHNHLTNVNHDGTLSYIDLFAGCGGLSLGLEAAGFRLVLAVEKSPMAAETFYHNFIKRLPPGKSGQQEWAEYRSLSVEQHLQRGLLCRLH